MRIYPSAERWWRGELRRLRPPGGPMRRRADALEWRAALVAVLFVLLAVPLAVLTGIAVHGDLAAAADHQAATRTAVTAAVVDELPAGGGLIEPALDRMGTVEWTDAAGVSRVGSVPVPAAIRNGATLRIWIGGDGAPVAQPIPAGRVVVVAIGATVAVEAGAVVTAIAAYAVARRFLDRRRLRDWELAWAAFDADQSHRKQTHPRQPPSRFSG